MAIIFTTSIIEIANNLSCRFGDVAELVECTSLNIYVRPAPGCRAHAGDHLRRVPGVRRRKGAPRPELPGPGDDGGAGRGTRGAGAPRRVPPPDEAEARKFRAVSRGTGDGEPRRPRLRADGWSEMEMGRLRTPGDDGGREAPAAVAGEEVAVSFEVLGWYPKRGLIVEGVEFRPVN